MAVRGRKARKRTAKPPAKRARKRASTGATKLAAAKSRLRKAPASKTKAPASKRKPPDTIAQSEIARLKRELSAARDRRTASAEILRAIAAAPGDAQRSLQQIAETAERLFAASAVTIRIAGDGDAWSYIVNVGAGAKLISATVSDDQLRIGGHNMPSTIYLENRLIHLPDLANVDAEIADWPGLKPSRAAGTRTLVGIPLRREGNAIGAMIVHRKRVAAFSEDELALLQSFADQAVIAIENARSFNETQEALKQQTATADVLQVISSSPGKLEPVFKAVLENAIRICDAGFGTLLRFDGHEFWFAAGVAMPPALAEYARRPGPFRNLPAGIVDRVLKTRQVNHVADYAGDPAPGLAATLGGARSTLGVPILKDDVLLGALVIYRQEVRAFAEREIALVQGFATQAAIAIENARLINETREALEHQTATAEVLQVISGSMADARPVFDRIVDSIARLFEYKQIGIFLTPGDGMLHYVAGRGGNIDLLNRIYPQPVEQSAAPAVLGRKQQVYYADVVNGADVPSSLRQAGQLIENFSDLLTPMLWEGRGVGMIAVTREPNVGFSDKEFSLLRTFADQAVIAIENARLFNETREALERQTATADVLKVIASSPSELQPVFDAIAERSNRLLGGHSTIVQRFVGDTAQLAAFTPTTVEADTALKASFPRRLKDHPVVELVYGGDSAIVADTEADSRIPSALKELARVRGFRSMLMTPLAGETGPIGLISVVRSEPGGFAPHHVQLLRTFADQAVIAIQNVRLFEEVQARTRDLTEALQQQTATADVLKVISRSAFDLDSVMNTLTQSASELCKAEVSALYLREGDALIARGVAEADATEADFLRRTPLRISDSDRIGRALLTGTIFNIGDAESENDEGLSRFARTLGFKSCLFVPLMRDGRGVGVFTLARKRVGEYPQREVDLVQTFADQAVIAIENVRLFDEVQAKTRDLEESLQFQTASGEVLKAISQSPDALQPVLDVIVETSRELCGSRSAVILLLREGKFHLAAESGLDRVDPSSTNFIRDNPIAIDRTGSAMARAGREKRTIHIPNSNEDPEAGLGGPLGVGAPRALLSVPLMRDDQVVGGITLVQSHLTPFTARQIEAVETFADQAVIAISNVNLFEQVQQRTRELSQSLDELRTAQDRLVQTEKLASLGQLTAGIAHEIKNPLNFVNNFSALSSELIDELLDVLKPAELAGNTRQEVDELTHMLKDNLGKVVQHGKRADSIVKNMLMHSRSGAGERRAVEINGIVEESLNLAYHGARAEKTGFNITLKQDFDPDAGLADVFPQEIARVFLNLISNGFYAAAKRATESGNGFEPVLSASTKNLGDRIEIRIRDNGTGIPAEVKDKMFNPFFTTKPAGEGTGLGLSISHDIIVKQHGGTIDVATEPGAFTEFTITLPRAQVGNGEGRA